MYASAEVVECYDAKGEDVCVARFSDGAVCEAVLAEAIPESEAKLCDAVPVAEIFGADAFGDESDDDKGCVEVKLSELCARVDLDGVKRRALELRDCLFCDRAFRLRGDAAAGGLEDVEAVVLRDADLRRTLLHHAAELGARAGKESEIPNSKAPLSAAVRAYCDMRDDRRLNALEIALDARHDDCVQLLLPFTTDDGTKETKAEPAFAPRADRDEPKAEANMGGAVVSRELFPGREEYENWSLDCVQQTMAQLKAEHGTIYDRAMDRSHYFNLFNNYEHQNAVTGSFMTLPMDHFSRYLTGEAETSDDGVLRIHLRRPLAMLTLLCDVEGTDSALDRLKMLLELATASATAEAIARPELERLLLDVAQGLRVCGVLKGEVKPKDIADMADNVWKRADGPAANGGTGATTSLPFVKKGPKKLDADSSSDRFKRARARHSIRQVRNRAEAEAGKKIDALLEDTHDPDAASHAVRQDVKNRKKKLNAVATTKALTDLMIATDMAFTDLLDLRETFFNVTQVQPAIHGGSKVISVEQLTELLLARFQNLEDGRVLQRATRAFDVNRDGKVDFDEFVIGMARFMPTDDVAAQLAYIFSLYDVNRDGNVELWEVTDVLEDHEDDLGNMYEHRLKVNWKLDLNGDGKITMGEFFKVMGSEKIYINYCWNSLPPLHPAIAAATATLVACFRAKEHDATDTPRGAVQVAPWAARRCRRTTRATRNWRSSATQTSSRDRGRTRERNSQLQRLISRPFSTRFG
ncbi:calcineurin B subunit [Aureococcus anophagefferens]|nr:calcineurin B subunit [Aureococcus anophagefferens]